MPSGTRQFEHGPALVRSRGTPTRASKPLAPAPLPRLRRLGNAGVQRLARVQPALTVGRADDGLEREAERVADLTDVGIAPSFPISHAPAHPAGHPVDAGVRELIARASSGGGHPIRRADRGPFEQALGTDFGGVRVHTDGRADDLTRYLHA